MAKSFLKFSVGVVSDRKRQFEESSVTHLSFVLLLSQEDDKIVEFISDCLKTCYFLLYVELRAAMWPGVFLNTQLHINACEDETNLHSFVAVML